MGSKLDREITLGDYLFFALMFLVALVIILPLVWMYSASLQGLAGITRTPFQWIPKEFEFKNYAVIWEQGKLGNAFLSSLCASSLYLAFHLFLCSITGYIFAKYQFRYKNIIFTFIMITMMVPTEITFFPVYGIIRSIGAVNTYLGLILPGLISGFGIFFMRQFATYIPDEMLESARMDGCGNLRTFFQVVLPLLKSGVAALAILAFTYIWNDYAWPSLVLNSDSMRTLPVSLAMMSSSSFRIVNYNEVVAGGVIALTPVLVVFLIFQRQFVESVTNSGIKG